MAGESGAGGGRVFVADEKKNSWWVKKNKKPMPAKKKAVAAPGKPPLPKRHFFTPRSQVPEGETEEIPVLKIPPPVLEEVKPRFQPRPRYLMDPDTDVAYAEIVDGMAVCLETGQDMFEVHSHHDDYVAPAPTRKLSFAPPTSRLACTIVSQDLIDAGVLTESDFIAGEAGLTRAQYDQWVTKK